MQDSFEPGARLTGAYVVRTGLDESFYVSGWDPRPRVPRPGRHARVRRAYGLYLSGDQLSSTDSSIHGMTAHYANP